MSATNKTTNYELPLFVDNDQPTWLGDFNGAMNKIDADLGQIGVDATKALNTAGQALSLAKTNEQDIAVVDSQLAGTRDSALKNLIEQETTRATNAEQNLRVVDYVQPKYVGDFVSYNGKFYGDSANQPYINQGYCIGYQGNHMFALVNDDDSTAKLTQVDADLAAYAEQSSIYSDWGHANCLAFNRSTGHYYVYTDSTLGKLYIYDHNFSTRLTALNTPAGAYGNVAYDKATEKVWYVTYEGDIYELVDETNLVKQSVKFPQLFDQVNQIGQGMACYNGIAVFPCSSGTTGSSTGLIVGDITTGKIIKRTCFADCEPTVGTYGEWEDCDFDSDGNLYLSAAKNHATDASTTYCMVNYLFTCNIFTGSLGVTQRNPALEWNLDTRYTGFKSNGSVSAPFKDIAEWCLAVQTVPVPPKITKIGFKDTSAVTMNGLFFLDNARIYNLWFYGANNVTINGGFYVRGGSNVNIINRVQITECKDAPLAMLFRCTNSTLNCGTISLTKRVPSNITKPMLLQYTTRANIQNLLVDNVASTPDTDTLSGFGYTIGAPLTGKYVTA